MGDLDRVRIGDLVEPVASINPKRARGSFSYIDLGSIDRDMKVVGDTATIDRDAAPTRARQLLRTGDILVSTVRPNLNAVAQVPPSCDEAIGSTGFCVLRPSSPLDPDYLFHWVRTPQFIREMTKRATGASYPAISDRIVKDSMLPLPDLKSQQRVAKLLNTADGLRSSRKKTIELLDAIALSDFAATFGADTSSVCKQTRVDQAGEVQLGRQRAPKYQTNRFNQPYLRVANVYEARLNLSDVLQMDFDASEANIYELMHGDILLNEGQSTELVGRPAMWRDEIPGCCFQNTLIRFRPNPDLVEPEYALGLFRQYFRNGHFARVSSKTSSVAHMGASRFAAMPFAIPPLELQREFAHRRREARSALCLTSAQLTQLDHLFASLQSQAFKGEL